jgi:hypothetical protein
MDVCEKRQDKTAKRSPPESLIRHVDPAEFMHLERLPCQRTPPQSAFSSVVLRPRSLPCVRILICKKD